jgi:hypothetical protein
LNCTATGTLNCCCLSSIKLEERTWKTLYFTVISIILDRLCGLVVRVPGYRTEIYCVSCEVRIEFIYVM